MRKLFYSKLVFLIFVFAAFFLPPLSAQKVKYKNIIPNPGFEAYSSYPIGWFYTGRHFSRIQKYWFSATNTSPDVYGPKIMVPQQWKDKGFGQLKAYEGQSFVGITTYGCGSEKPHCKEYIEVQLNEPLVPGQDYMVSLRTAQLANTTPTNNLGIVFSEERVLHRNEDIILLQPTVNFSKVIQSPNKWKKIQSKFRATDASQYIVIGSFYSDGQCQSVPGNLPFSYYYLDDIVLKKVPPILPVPVDRHDLRLASLRLHKLITLHNVYFEFDKADLHPRSDKELQQLVAIMLNDPALEIEIIGHTDDMGSDAYNLTLSSSRANAIKKYLVQNNISASRLTTTGKGDKEPMATNKTEAGRQKNRRIEFRILKLNPNAPNTFSNKTSSRSGLR